MNPGVKNNFKRPFYWLVAAAFIALAFLNLPGFSSKANRNEINPDLSGEPTAAWAYTLASGCRINKRKKAPSSFQLLSGGALA